MVQTSITLDRYATHKCDEMEDEEVEYLKTVKTRTDYFGTSTLSFPEKSKSSRMKRFSKRNSFGAFRKSK